MRERERLTLDATPVKMIRLLQTRRRLAFGPIGFMRVVAPDLMEIRI